MTKFLILALITTTWATYASADQTADTIASLGLSESEIAARDLPGWRKPERIVVRVDESRLAWLAEVAGGVELVAVSDHEEAIARIGGADAVIGYCTEEVLAAGKDLRWIQLPYAGVESCLSIDAVKERDLLITNAQRIYGPGIAEHVMAMTLAFTRGLNVFTREQAKSNWNPAAMGQESSLWELTDKTMLVVGLGGIGTEVAKRASALGMTVTATRSSTREGPDFVSYVG
ncbi:MAG: NAD(P)-dependent oxidoreductase, partial [Gammaproteobacteria bacterium]